MSTTSVQSCTSSVQGALSFHAAMRTDVGRRRTENQDSYGYVVADNASVYIVADGMGGARGGGTASAVAVQILVTGCLSKSEEVSLKRLRRSIQLANKTIFGQSRQDPKLTGMGTTIVVLVLIGRRAVVAHVGDSRIYLWRQGRLHQLTRDHTLVQELVDTGAIAQKDAASHPIAHMLTRSLGPTEATNIEMHELPDAIQPGDKFLLCSDGLYNHVSSEQIAETLSNESPEDAADHLLQAALDGGGSDNVTLQVIEVTPFGATEQQKGHRAVASSEVNTADLAWFSPGDVDTELDSGSDDWDEQLMPLEFSENGEVLTKVSGTAVNGTLPPDIRKLTEVDPHGEAGTRAIPSLSAQLAKAKHVHAPQSAGVGESAATAAVPAWKRYGAPASVALVAILGLFLFIGGSKNSSPKTSVTSPAKEHPPLFAGADDAALPSASMPAASVPAVNDAEREELTKEMLENPAETSTTPATDAKVADTPLAGESEESLDVKEENLIKQATEEKEATKLAANDEAVKKTTEKKVVEIPAPSEQDPANVPPPEALADIPREIAQQIDLASDIRVSTAPRIIFDDNDKNAAGATVPIVWEHEERRVDRLLDDQSGKDGKASAETGDKPISKKHTPQELTATISKKADVRDRIADIDAKLEALLIRDKEEAHQRDVRLEMEIVRTNDAINWAHKEAEEATQALKKWQEVEKRRSQLEFTQLTEEVANISPRVKQLRQDYLKLMETYLAAVEDSQQDTSAQPEAAANLAALGRQVKMSRQNLETAVQQAVKDGSSVAAQRLHRANLAAKALERRQGRLNRQSGILKAFIPMSVVRKRELRNRYLEERGALAKNLSELRNVVSDEDELALAAKDAA